MKNQYFGDINDYRKYGLLRQLAATGLQTTVAWMLTPDDCSSDGRRLGYLSKPEVWERYDPRLFASLEALLSAPIGRRVELVENSLRLGPLVSRKSRFVINKRGNGPSVRSKPMKPFLPARLPAKLAWEGLIPELGRANRQLARYDGLLQGMVNPEVLLAPLRTREAVLSSKIEGTRATLREVLEFEADPVPQPGPRAEEYQEILNYRSAMELAVAELERRPLSLNLIRRLHRRLMTGVRGQSRAPGQFRRVQNFIGPPGADIEQATFVPPSPDRLMPLLDNLEKYIHSEEKDTVAQAGLVHAQFEMIHPFLDGNGRVGRMLVPLFLFARQVLATPAFYLSAYFEAYRDQYYDRLRGVSERGDYEGWLRFFLEAVAEQAADDVERIRRILGLYERMKEVVAESTRSKYSLRTLDTLFAWPLFSTPQFVRLSDVPAPSAARILHQIGETGSIRVIRPGRGRRPTVWMFPELLEIVR